MFQNKPTDLRPESVSDDTAEGLQREMIPACSSEHLTEHVEPAFGPVALEMIHNLLKILLDPSELRMWKCGTIITEEPLGLRTCVSSLSH